MTAIYNYTRMEEFSYISTLNVFEKKLKKSEMILFIFETKKNIQINTSSIKTLNISTFGAEMKEGVSSATVRRERYGSWAGPGRTHVRSEANS